MVSTGSGTTETGTAARVSAAAQRQGLPARWARELANSMAMWDAEMVTTDEVVAALVHRVQNPGAAVPAAHLGALVAAVREPGSTARIARAVVSAWHLATFEGELDQIAASRAA